MISDPAFDTRPKLPLLFPLVNVIGLSETICAPINEEMFAEFAPLPAKIKDCPLFKTNVWEFVAGFPPIKIGAGLLFQVAVTVVLSSVAKTAAVKLNRVEPV